MAPLLLPASFFASLCCAIAFTPVLPQSHRSAASPFCRPSASGRATTRCRYRNFNDTGTDTVGSELHGKSWTLVEDWALIDGVRDFTLHVEDPRRSYTFWDRMVRTKPELRGRSARDARKRYEYVFRQQMHNDSSNGEAVTVPEIPVAGMSPPLLHQWWVHANDHMTGIGGTLDDGRKVWFPVQCLGRLDGHAIDLLAPSGGPGCLSAVALPGGYVETPGGKVYELGSPRVGLQDATSNVAKSKEPSNAVMAFHQTAMATVLALSTVGLFSLAIGFHFGQYVSHDAVATTVEVPQQYMGAPVKGATMTIPASSMHAAVRSTARTPPSIQELRARQEFRVLREKRLLRDIEGRLEGDEARLADLRQLEQTAVRQDENINAGGQK